jgi:mono/diheme cytochrome c family protein
MRSWPKQLSIVAISLAVAGAALGAQTTGPIVPPLAIKSMYGPDLYRHYCASCHGRDGTGGGPAASSLKSEPPDLTGLARRRNGVFPRRDVEAIIRGGSIAAHGSEEMPVWGPIFKALDPSDARVDARIESLALHLESIQRR